MSTEAKFVDGLRVYAPRDNAPDFVIANLVVSVAELREWMSKRTENEVRIDIKRAKSGKYYASENDYRTSGQRQGQPQRQPTRPAQTDGFEDSEIPF